MTETMNFWVGQTLCQIAKTPLGNGYLGWRNGRLVGTGDDTAAVMRIILKSPGKWDPRRAASATTQAMNVSRPVADARRS